MATNRNMKLPGVWAKDALTTIPQPPVSGIAYRNDSMTEAEANQGQQYGSIGDSAQWNQELWAATTLLKEAESQGVLSWSPLIDYGQGALVMGTDNTLYQALQASGPATAPQDPTLDTTHVYWLLFDLSLKADIAEAMFCNTRSVLTTSGTFTAPVTGWYHIKLLGGGGGGAGGVFFSDYGYTSGGGGGAGGIKSLYAHLTKDATYTYTIGAGGAGGARQCTGYNGGATSITIDGQTYSVTGGKKGGLSTVSEGTGCTFDVELMPGGLGGWDGSDPSTYGMSGCNGGVENTNNPLGGIGGGFGGGVATEGTSTERDAVGYGAGGAGGTGSGSPDNANIGGAGKQGCIIVEYYDPTINA